MIEVRMPLDDQAGTWGYLFVRDGRIGILANDGPPAYATLSRDQWRDLLTIAEAQVHPESVSAIRIKEGELRVSEVIS